MRGFRNIGFVVALALVVSCSSASSNSTETSSPSKDKSDLPIYGVKEFIPGVDEDTIYHTVGEWRFVNQSNVLISKSDYTGKPYVAYFFFTHCPKICPKINSNMKYFQEQTEGLDFNVIAHTVDPDRDSVERLRFYGDEYGFDYSNYNFVTGNRDTIYSLGVNGYMVPNQEDALAPGGFLHSEKLILVDSKGRIRGYYEGTEKAEVDRLIEDLNLLIELEKNE